ncbi:MAG: hypothetical protein RI947_1351 [Candidatus Parcubacteria bacterium]|jgi:nitrosocyanin
MNKTVTIVVVLAVLAVAGGAIYMNSAKTAPQPTNDNTAMQAEPSTTETTAMEGVKEFTVTGSNFSFDTKEIKVKKGDTVKVTFKNADGMHDFIIDEFNVKTKQIKGGEEETVEFVADQTGTFEYYCSVGQHRQNGMVGKLIVQ